MKKRFKVIAPFFALVIGLILPNATFAAGVNCNDFGTWQEAQAWFEAHGGSPTNNVEQLDGMTENNKGEVGIACESNKGYAGQTWNSISHPFVADGGAGGGAVTPSPAPMPNTATNHLQTLMIGAIGMIVYLFLRRTLNKSGS
jgi:hypothetical protein